MKRTIILLLALCSVALAQAQPTYIRSYDTFTDAVIAGVDRTPDNGLILALRTGPDNKLLRLDAMGNVLWSRSYPAVICSTFDGAYGIRFEDVTVAADSGLVVVGPGIPLLGGIHGTEQLIIRTDASGIPTWGRTNGNLYTDYLAAATTSGPNVLVAGRIGDALGGRTTLRRIDATSGEETSSWYSRTTDPDLSFNQPATISLLPDGSTMLVSRYWAMFVKYDPSFNVQWSGSWIELHNGSVEGLADGSVLFADTANVVRFAPTGTITWSIALQPAYGYIRGMALRPDGRLLLAGAHPDGYAWLTELDPDGVVDWSFRYGDPGDSYVPEEMLLMPDGGIRIVGTAGLAPARPWVMALDSTGALGSCSYPAFAPQFFATTLTPWEAVNTGFEGTGLYTCSLATTAQNSYIPTEQSCTGGGLALAGRVFHDADLDGIWSTGEACFPYIMVGMQPEALMSMTTTGCDYQFLTTVPGAHTVAPIPLNPWWDLSTDSSSSTVQYNGGDSTIVGQDFGFTPAYDTTVLTGTLITAPILCSTWFNTSTMGALHVLNTGTTTPDVVVGLTLDSLLSLVSSEPAPDSIVGQTAYWHLNAIGFFNIADIDMQLHSTAWSGDTLHSVGHLLNPLDPADTLGTFTWSSPVLCAYDPNDKLVAPSGNIAPEQDWLTYTVRFQNTGTAAAANVMIQDQLSLLVDPASLHYLGSSHDVTDIHVGSAGLAEFRFDNIQLPDSGADEPGSHGHITFRIRPLAGLHHLDSITNDAAIFFDLNAPVITNVVLSRVIDCAETTWEAMLFDNGDGVLWGGVDMSGAFTYTYQWLLNGEPLVGEMMMSITPEVSGSYQVMQTDQYGCARTSEQLTFVLTGIAEPGRNMFIAPNPMSDVAHVVFSEPLSSDARMELVDVHGRVVRTMNGKGSRQVLIERGHLESGIYVVRLISDHGQLGAVRLVVD